MSYIESKYDQNYEPYEYGEESYGPYDYGEKSYESNDYGEESYGYDEPDESKLTQQQMMQQMMVQMDQQTKMEKAMALAKKNSGFLPEERAWIDKIINHYNCVDAFRFINDKPDNYTWWSNRGRAWDNNVGWRIDYQMLSSQKNIAILSADIYKKERFSDHSPLIIDYDI